MDRTRASTLVLSTQSLLRWYTPSSPVPPFPDSAVPQTTSLLAARLGDWEGDDSGRAGATSLVSRLLAKLA